MHATASIRDLRNHFPKVRKLLDAEGEVLLTESGETKYRLIRYVTPPEAPPAPLDFWARLTASQPRPISAAAAQSLYEENRGDR